MKKITWVAVTTIVFFLWESVLFDLFGHWFKPNFIVLLVIFFDAHFGIRYSLLTSFLGGLLKDSFTAGVFGINLISSILCAYATTLIKRYIYHTEFVFSRVLIVLLISLLNALSNFVLTNILSGKVDAYEAFIFVILPEVLITALISGYIFDQLRRCVLKSSV